MAYKIVFFDIDGTLVNHDKRIPPSTKEAIKKLQERDVEVVIATGRAPYHFKPIGEELGIDSFVSFNGSYVVHQGQIVHENPIGRETLSALENIANAYNHPIVYLGNEKCFSNYEQHPHVIESFHSLKVSVPGYHPNYWQETNIYQALLFCRLHEEDYYKNKVADISLIRWHELSMDVLPSGGSKAKGIEKMLEHLGLSSAEAVAFGDGLNDKEMLAYVGMGIAMGNAHEETKPFANFTTKSVDDGGIQYGLQKIGMI
ncbi:Cof-type HAD-IIB family hydrolase [Aneurinibacillus terranovensis]|uniref:Cof-type HAD-IIB family hydrolase n=1 Tax=Aneurinibacillus terranovensis TaxID=278991 RepID=UPI000414ECD6|nr:Cof-type HAD-IIB family hydrolase [Aneurinibacillus terranovensis]